MSLRKTMSLRTTILVALALLAGATRAQTGTPSALDPPRGDVRLVVLGDFNGPYGAVDYPAPLARAMAAIVDVWLPDLLLSPGDVIAGQDRDLPDDRFAAMWAGFDEAVVEPLRAACVPYAVAMGNHDASSQRSGGEYVFARDRQAAADYWSAHAPELSYQDRDGYPFDYSFTHAVNTVATAELFVIILDAASSAVTSEQRAWLAAQLSSPAAADAAARIVVGHLPLVPVSQGRDGPGEYLREGLALAAVLAAGSVDLYVSGHHAAYYPGRLGDVELLFAGGIGGRRLLGSSLAPRSTVTVVDMWFGGPAAPPTFAYTTFDLASMGEVDPGELPAAIGAVVLSGRAGQGAVALRGSP